MRLLAGPDLFPFETLAAVVAHAGELHRALAPKVDPRAETVRILNPNHKAA